MIIDVLTTTRADYGVFRPLLRKMKGEEDITPNVLVTGTHLSEEFGLTYKEIEKDGFSTACKIPILSKKKGSIGISETMANALTGFGNYFAENKPDFLLVDGDRYETLAVCIAAVNANIPIIHIGGGATTEGAVDEYYRHAMTKLCYLHFATTETYRNRIIQMGENPDRVFLVGSPLIENILNTQFLTKIELEKSINFNLDKPFSVVTFHPVTLEGSTALDQIHELIDACEENDMKYIFTMANADNGGDLINKELIDYANKHNDKVLCVKSLGSLRYYSALRYAAFVMGNSSSGIIEAPSFHIPTINIGDRQKGRIQAKSIINCKPTRLEIKAAINKAVSTDFKKICKTAVNPNGDGHTSDKMIEAIRSVWNKGINIKKSFFDISFNL